MPCGGIMLCSGTLEEGDSKDSPCWVCGKGNCHHFLEEWDSYIHARCAVKALADPESDVAMIIRHGHQVVLDFSLEEEIPDAT